MVRYYDIKVSRRDITACKREYLKNHTYHGTSKPVILDDKTAEIIVRGRKYHRAWLRDYHKSHKLTKWETKILAPAGTARFYTYRECKKCGRAQYYSNSGKFNELEGPCKGY